MTAQENYLTQSAIYWQRVSAESYAGSSNAELAAKQSAIARRCLWALIGRGINND